MRAISAFEQVIPSVCDQNLPSLLWARSHSHADKVFIKVPEDGQAITYADTYRLADSVATRLRTDGAMPGDRVLVMLPNSADFVLSWFGIALAGMIETTINLAFTGPLLEHQLRLSSPTTAVIDARFAERFVHAGNSSLSIRRFYVRGEEAEVRDAIGELTASGRCAEPIDRLYGAQSLAPQPPVTSNVDAPANIIFTSGTTGPSKAVVLPYGQGHVIAETMRAAMGATESDVCMTELPLYHVTAKFIALYPMLLVGGEIVLYARFSASKWLSRIRENNVTLGHLIGGMMGFIAAQERSDLDADNVLRCVCAGPPAWPILDDFSSRFKIESFVEAFGMSEIGVPILAPRDERRPVGAKGLLVEQFFEAELIDSATGLKTPTGEAGELRVRPREPHYVTIGYQGMPTETAEMIRDGWVYTGDLMCRDSDGWFYFVGRSKDAIRRRGENISCSEIEGVLESNPNILECAIIGVEPDSADEESEVLAAIVLREEVRPGREIAESIWTWADSNVPAFAVPRYLRFEPSLPRTPTHKIIKGPLKAAGRARALDRLSVASGRHAKARVPVNLEEKNRLDSA